MTAVANSARARRESTPRRVGAGSLTAAVAPGLTAIDASTWDRLVPAGRGALRHGFLSAWEQAELAGLQSRPIIVYDERRSVPVAAAAGYLYDLDMATIQGPLFPGAVRTIRRVRPRFLTTRVYELGAPAARVDPLLLDRDVNATEVAAAVAATALREADEARAAMIIVQDFVSPDSAFARALRGTGFSSVATLPTIVLELDLASFDEYLASMRAKYRRRARCVLRGSAHLSVSRIDDFSAFSDEFSRLWRLVYDRADETKREILSKRFFAAAARLDEMTALVLRRPDSSVAAFGLLLEDAPWLHFLQCGFEAGAGRREAAYFRLLLEIVRAGIDGRFRFVNFGCTTTGPKLDLGGVPVSLSAWIRHKNPAAHRLFVLGGNGRFAPPPPAPRKVFAAC